MVGGIRGNKGERISIDGVVKVDGGRGLREDHIDVEISSDDNGGEMREVVSEAVEKVSWIGCMRSSVDGGEE